jgi:predicted adenylyl cyclase CyaB
VPRNVEVKARVPDLMEVEARARRVATDGPMDLAQEDTFFACRNGRLKLRQFAHGPGELIHYFRDDDPGPKISEYWISPIESPGMLRESLARALGVVGRVRKRRRVYLVDRTRIHLDVVESIGCFVELEVVLAHGESLEAGNRVARELMAKLGIAQNQLVEGAYVDMQPCGAIRRGEPLAAEP